MPKSPATLTESERCWSRTTGAGAALLFGVALTACNSLTGINSLTDEGANGGGGGLGGPGATPPLAVLGAAPGVTITEIDLYQTLKCPLMAGGTTATSPIPIVAGRDAMIRVFVSTDSGYDGNPVTARLSFEGNDTPIELTQPLTGKSTEADLATTLNFKVPGASLPAGVKYRVTIGRVATTPSSAPLAYPAMGYDPIAAVASGTVMKIKLIPIAYKADGSGRVPDTSPDQVKAFTDAFRAMYPIPSVEITVRAPMPWSQQVSPNGSGWSQLLAAVSDLRNQDNAAPELHYYGVFNPAGSFDQFCNGGCVAGLGMLGAAGDAHSRAAIGLGYTGADGLTTALHELGHTQGRQHAPCQTPDPDPNFPHPKGADGVWGYDLLKDVLYPPTMSDIMGYCQPTWISDYTYTAFFNRLKTVNNAELFFPESAKDKIYERVLVDGMGGVQWLASTKLHLPPMADEKTITVESGGASEALAGRYYRFDHLDGGILYWPVAPTAHTAVRLEVAGKMVRLTR